MFKNFKLFEKHTDTKYTLKDYTLSEIINKPSKGERVYHVNSGPGTVTKMEKNDVIFINFDMSPSSKVGFVLSILTKNGLIKMIDKEPVDSTGFPVTIPETEDKNVKDKENVQPENKVETSDDSISVDDDEDEEMEEEEDDDDDDFYLEDITADELMTMNLTEFFNEGEIGLLVSLDDVLNFRKSVEGVNDEDLNPFKKTLKYKKINMTYLMEKYYKHLMDRIPGKSVYRFNGQIPYPELWDIRQKDRIKISDELKDDTIFNSGVLFFWIFKDSIVFKTI